MRTFSNNNFSERVYEGLKLIPIGRITTYTILAKAVGRPKAFRAVGNVLARNKELVAIPCHRVVKSDGKLGNYQKGEKAKKNILEQEGLKVDIKGRIVDFNKHLFHFNKR